jgi:hypothetical protein
MEGLGRACLQIPRGTFPLRVRPSPTDLRPLHSLYWPENSLASFTSLSPRFALDLVEVYFQVVHTRLPFLNPTHFRARLNVDVPQYASIYANNSSASGTSAEETLHPALMATVVAWGAKFSEHPLLVADRLNSPTRQSGLAKTLIVRAREVAEALKVHRVPAAEHVVIALLIEPLQSRTLSSVPSFVVLRIMVAILTRSLFLVSRGSRRCEWSVFSSSPRL